MRPSSLVLETIPLHGTPPYAEAVIERKSITISVALGAWSAEDVQLDVTQRALRLRSRTHPGDFHVGYELPAAVDAGAYVASLRNGVLEIVVMRL
jgi:HSP20 family molecular chaperone IbpA